MESQAWVLYSSVFLISCQSSQGHLLSAAWASFELLALYFDVVMAIRPVLRRYHHHHSYAVSIYPLTVVLTGWSPETRYLRTCPHSAKASSSKLSCCLCIGRSTLATRVWVIEFWASFSFGCSSRMLVYSQ